MHQNVLLVAAGLFCSPIFAAPNVNNRLHARKGHRQRQVPSAYLPPFYGPPPELSTAEDETSTVSPADSTSIVDPLLPPIPTTTSACSVIRITEYVTVYGTSTSTSSPGNSTAAPPYGWNSTVTSLIGTGTSVTTMTADPYFPISNSTTTTPFGTTDGTSAPTFANITTTVNSTEIPTSTLVVPSNFTSFPNISTPDITPTPLPTSAVIPGNFTTFVNTTTSTEISILPIPVSSFANTTTSAEVSVLPIPVSSYANTTTTTTEVSVLPIPVSSYANTTTSAEVTVLPIPVSSYANVTSVPASTTTEEPTSTEEPSVTSIIILPTETTVIVPGESSTATVITSLVIDPSEPPLSTATSTSASTTPTLVIVTTVPPIATASETLSELPTTVVTATNTYSSGDAPTGTPSPEVIHCGIRGVALGTYYLATYAYNRANVPVTLQGCYQFCSVAVEQCYSYEFYLEPGLGSPRCKLYGGLVAYEVTSIDPFQPYQWFDLACGDPTKFGT